MPFSSFYFFLSNVSENRAANYSQRPSFRTCRISCRVYDCPPATAAICNLCPRRTSTGVSLTAPNWIPNGRLPATGLQFPLRLACLHARSCPGMVVNCAKPSVRHGVWGCGRGRWERGDKMAAGGALKSTPRSCLVHRPSVMPGKAGCPVHPPPHHPTSDSLPLRQSIVQPPSSHWTLLIWATLELKRGCSVMGLMVTNFSSWSPFHHPSLSPPPPPPPPPGTHVRTQT